MNLLEVGVTPDGRYVIAAFQGLPYLFVFDGDHKHIRTIRFAGEAISDHARSYALKTPGMPGTGLRWLIHAVHVLSNEHLMPILFTAAAASRLGASETALVHIKSYRVLCVTPYF